MKKLFIMQVIIGIALSLFIMPASAKDIKDGVNTYKNAYYGPNAFSRLAGEDGVLSEEDWTNNRSAIETKYGPGFRWEKAMGFDTDGDGALSPSEARAYRDAEAGRLKSEWKSKGNKLTPEDKRWLKNHPEAAKKIYKTAKKHPNKVKKAYKAGKKYPNKTKKVARNPRAAKRIVKGHKK